MLHPFGGRGFRQSMPVPERIKDEAAGMVARGGMTDAEARRWLQSTHGRLVASGTISAWARRRGWR
jgi:hypothetical protein